MKDQQITQLSILGVVSIVGLIAAIGLLSTPSTNTAIPVGGGQQDTVVGQQALDLWGLGSTDTVSSEEEYSTSENTDPLGRNQNRQNSQDGTYNTADIDYSNVEEAVEDAQRVIKTVIPYTVQSDRPGSVHLYTNNEVGSTRTVAQQRSETANRGINNVNQLNGALFSDRCSEASSVFRSVRQKARQAEEQNNVNDANAYTTLATGVFTAMTQGNCWLEAGFLSLGENYEETSFVDVEIGKSYLSLTTRERHTVNAIASLTALRLNSFGRDQGRLSNTMMEVVSELTGTSWYELRNAPNPPRSSVWLDRVEVHKKAVTNEEYIGDNIKLTVRELKSITAGLDRVTPSSVKQLDTQEIEDLASDFEPVGIPGQQTNQQQRSRGIEKIEPLPVEPLDQRISQISSEDLRIVEDNFQFNKRNTRQAIGLEKIEEQPLQQSGAGGSIFDIASTISEQDISVPSNAQGTITQSDVGSSCRTVCGSASSTQTASRTNSNSGNQDSGSNDEFNGFSVGATNGWG